MSQFHAISFAEVEQGTDEWRAARKNGIGGSDAAAAIGMSKYTSPLELWLEKTGQAEGFAGNWHASRGTALEPLIRQHYAEMTGRDVKIPRHLLQHPVHKFMLASIDGFTDDGRLQEFKAPTSDYGWGKPGTDEIPAEYLVQCQHNMIVTGLTVSDVGASFGGTEPVYYEVKADVELQALIIEKEAAFWSMVELGVRPAITSVSDALAAYPFCQPITLEADEIMADDCAELKAINAEIRGLYAQADQIKARIMSGMGTADTLCRKGKLLATFKEYESGGRKLFIK